MTYAIVLTDKQQQTLERELEKVNRDRSMDVPPQGPVDIPFMIEETIKVWIMALSSTHREDDKKDTHEALEQADPETQRQVRELLNLDRQRNDQARIQ